MAYTIYRDLLHKDILLDPLSRACIDSPQMQRLGRVFQLGYTHLVYRGATHSRLSHAIGVSQLARDFVSALKSSYAYADSAPQGAIFPTTFLPFPEAPITEEDRWEILSHLCAWAGLLHDLGHVAFGHTLEDEFERIYERHDDLCSPRMPYCWGVKLKSQSSCEPTLSSVFGKSELYPPVFQKLFSTFKVTPIDIRDIVMLIVLHKKKRSSSRTVTFEQLLNSYQSITKKRLPKSGELPLAHTDEGTVAEEFSGYLLDALRKTGAHGTKAYHPYMSDIVANTICADYLDYINRDAINLGLDPLLDRRVLSRFWIGQERQHPKDFHMCLSLKNRHGKDRLDTSTGVIDLFRRRFRFAEVVYYHKTKASASAMLVKAFSLLGKPPEINFQRELLKVNNLKMLRQSLPASKRDFQKWFSSIETKFRPSAMMDVEVGDETLTLLLQEKAWERAKQIVAEEKTTEADINPEVWQLMHGISLLQMLASRDLYKVALTIDSNSVATLTGQGNVSKAVEASIQELLGKFRDSKDAHSARNKLERDLAVAAGFPSEDKDNTFILYVPGRKSQAKGIETGALSSGGAITLETHDAVAREVEELGEKYKSLWKIVLFVRPDYRGSLFRMQMAAEELLKEIGKTVGIEPKREDLTKALAQCCWFECISPSNHSFAQSVLSIERQVLASISTSRGKASTDISNRFDFPWHLLASSQADDLEMGLTFERRMGIFNALGVFEKSVRRVAGDPWRGGDLESLLPKSLENFKDLAEKIDTLKLNLGKNAQPPDLSAEASHYLASIEIAEKLQDEESKTVK